MPDKVLNTHLWPVFLTLSRRTSLLYRNLSIDLQSKSKDWFLSDRDLRHERVNYWSRVIMDSPLVQFFRFSPIVPFQQTLQLLSRNLSFSLSSGKSEAVTRGNSMRQLFLNVSPNSQEITCVKVSFLIKWQTTCAYNFFKKRLRLFWILSRRFKVSAVCKQQSFSW